MVAWWKGPFLVLLIGLILFAYIHDGPPYWEWSDLFDSEWHHEKIIALLAAVTILVWFWRE